MSAMITINESDYNRARERILETWPHAKWMPWDVPPVGEIVRVIDRPQRRYRVVKCYEPGPPRASEHCPSCTCKEAFMEKFENFWVLECLDYWMLPEGNGYKFVPPGTPNAIRSQSLEYPPSLLPSGID